MQQNFIMRPLQARAIKVILLAAVLLLSACSMVRVAYSNGETLSYWWINGYIDIESGQKPWVKARIDRFFEWHRKTQLADYVQFLKLAQRQLQQPTEKSTMLSNIAELKKRSAILIEHALPDLADLALDLRPQQIVEIEKKYATNNSTFRKNYLRGDLAQRQQYRFKKVMDQSAYWFGDFNGEQERVIRKAFDLVPIESERIYAQRLRRQHELLDTLKKIAAERPRREVALALLRGQALALLEPPTGESSAYFTAYYDGMTNLAVTVMNSTTPVQREHASLKLQEFIDDFSRLSR